MTQKYKRKECLGLYELKIRNSINKLPDLGKGNL